MKEGHPVAIGLIDWYSREKRDLPWRNSGNPYKVWLSEIILQQTRVTQGLSYYYHFIETYPTVVDLASATEQQVLKSWEGLGYYSRARNLHKAAKQIVSQYDGHFPKTYDELLSLKGIGPYTAAAIASICFGQPTPVVDGNVFRVVARLFKVKEDISAPKTRKLFTNLLLDIIDSKQPGDFNQAIMELGALICTPKNPACDKCCIQTSCDSFQDKSWSQFPIKGKKVKVKKRKFSYYLYQHEGYIAMKKRSPGDIWEGLWEFQLTENDSNSKENEVPFYKHILTHQIIEARFYKREVSDTAEFNDLLNRFQLVAVSVDEVLTLPKSKLIVNYLNDHPF
ncbi:MAG: A/G-specific adenine glycosylase [Cyclobacteriaceae bacterium]